MRLHSLVLTGVGPFKERQEIDFDALSASGLFLIEGPTGSGKTTIIDAIVYALFGVVSAGSDDVTRMRIRSHYCSDTDPTGVALEFSVDGRRHRITRVPAGARDPEQPSRAARTQHARQALTEYRDGEPVVHTRAEEIRRHVVALLGMTAEQFRQLVVLPQGQFADLLRQTPNDRLKSLSPLLEDSFIAAVQDDLKAHGELAVVERTAAESAVDRAAQQLVGRVAAHKRDDDPDLADGSLADQDRAAAAHGMLERLRSLATEADRERGAQRTVVEQLELAATTADSVLRALTQAEGAAREVDRAREALGDADRGVTQDDIDARLAELNRLAGGLHEHAGWEQAAAERAVTRADLARELDEVATTISTCQQEALGLPHQRQRIADLRQAAAQEAAGVEPARATLSRWQELAALTEQLAGLRRDEDAIAATLDAARQEESAADTAELASLAHWQQLVLHQRAATAAELAAHLAPGAPCLVCGSTEHPAPAAMAGELVRDDDITAALAAANATRVETAAARTRVSSIERELAEVTGRRTSVEAALQGTDSTELAAGLLAAEQALADAEKAAELLPELDRQLADLDTAERALDARLAGLATDSALLEQQITAHDEQERKRQEQIAAVIGDASSATDLLNSVTIRVAALNDMADAWRALALATARIPDDADRSIEQARSRAEAARGALAVGREALAEVDRRAVTLISAAEETAPLVTAFEKALAHRQAVTAATAGAVELAALVTASNPRRLQLRSYALQRRFAAVLVAASSHLERMSSGKFTFELNDDAARAGQAGLGIWLYDSWTGSTQDPKSLSGGESFYASLALALGLADVIRGEAGGSALETLFVDEGFGSLDQDTLHQVLDQLDHLRAGNRAVGVVSHVTEMKESIPDRIEVRRLPDSTSAIESSSA